MDKDRVDSWRERHKDRQRLGQDLLRLGQLDEGGVLLVEQDLHSLRDGRSTTSMKASGIDPFNVT